jgi:rubrerythrin
MEPINTQAMSLVRCEVCDKIYSPKMSPYGCPECGATWTKPV